MNNAVTDRRWLLGAQLSLTVASAVALLLVLRFFVLGGDGAELSGSFSSVVGVPIALLALFVYIVLLFAASKAGKGTRFWVITERASCLVILAFAVWFSALQYGKVGQFCPLCSLAHMTGVAGAGILIAVRERAGSGFRPGDFALAACVAALVFESVLVADWLDGMTAQGGGTRPLVASASGADGTGELLAVYGGELQIGLADLPIWGSVAAPRKLLALVDPTHPQCQTLEPVLESVPSAYGNDVAVVLVPAVRGEESEAIQRYLLALWHCEPGAYRMVRHELAQGILLPSRTRVTKRVVDCIGAAKLRESLQRNEEAITRAITFGRRLRVINVREGSTHGLPQLMFGDRVIAPADSRPETLSGLIAEHFEVTPKAQLASAPGAALEFVDGQVIHLGDVAVGSRQEFQVALRNRGSEELEVQWVQLPRDCKVSTLPRAPIAAGHGGALRFEFEGGAQPGLVERTLVFNHNGFGKQAKLTLMARVIAQGSSKSPGAQMISVTEEQFEPE